MKNKSDINEIVPRVALYMRVSSGPQAVRDLSIPDQRKAMARHCADLGWTIVSEFVDARSGRTDNRPEYQKMLEQTKGVTPPFDVIMVHSFSRFFRDAFEFESQLRDLAKQSVRVVSLTQDIEDSPTGKMIRNIINLFDQYSSEETAKHVRRTMRENAAQGFHTGGVTPFGYKVVVAERRGSRDKKKLAINSEEAAIVELVFDLYQHGDGTSGPKGVKRTTEWLNEHGYRTRLGSYWGSAQVYRLLTDPVYNGRYVYGRRSKANDAVTVPVPAIIPDDVFQAVGKTLSDRNPKALPPRLVTGPILLSGLVKCPNCGGGLTTTTGKGGRYKYYSCSAKIRNGDKGCTGFHAPMEEIDKYVLNAILNDLLTQSKISKLISSVCAKEDVEAGKSAEKLMQFIESLQQANDRLQRLYIAIEKGVVDIEDPTLKDRIDLTRRTRDDAKAAVENMKNTVKPEFVLSEANIGSFIKIMRKNIVDQPNEIRRGYLRKVIDAIEVGPTTIRIHIDARRLRDVVNLRPDAPQVVPTFVREWRMGWDSNPRYGSPHASFQD